jgi:hypothetical protein
LVLHYVTRVGGRLRRTYIDNFFKGPHKAPQTIGILDFLLKSTSVFDQFDELFFSGDTGSGFRQDETIYYYTTLKGTYGKDVAAHFLAPWHAFSMANSHGGHVAEVVHEDSEAIVRRAVRTSGIRQSNPQKSWFDTEDEKGQHHGGRQRAAQEDTETG